MRNVACSYHFTRFFTVTGLIIEKHIGGERLKEGRLLQTAEKQRLVQTDVPFAQGANHPFMGGCRARRDQRRADRAACVGKLALQLIERSEKRFERPAAQGSRADSRSLA